MASMRNAPDDEAGGAGSGQSHGPDGDSVELRRGVHAPHHATVRDDDSWEPAALVEGGSADDPVASLGPQIRGLRRANGLTIAELAKRAQMSVGHLSQVERGLSTPTIRQLQDLATAMGVRIGWFFQEDAPLAIEDNVVVRADRRKAMHLEGLGVTDYLLVPHLEGRLELLLCVFEPGGGSGAEPYSHDGEECGVVITGRLELWVNHRRYLLEEGDSFAFPSTQPHRYRNPGDTETRVIWAITPPTY